MQTPSQENEYLQTVFDQAQKRLQETFSHYPCPQSMEACPCCTYPYEKSGFQLKEKDFGRYLGKAMTTWGNEKDFKSYICKLFHFVFLEKNLDYTSFLLSKLNYITHWENEEIQTLSFWLNAYARLTYFTTFSQNLEKQRQHTELWLKGDIQDLPCETPLSIFTSEDFEDLIPFLSLDLIEQFSDFLFVWPFDEIDFIVYANCIKSHSLFPCDKYGFYNYGIFDKKVKTWITKNTTILESFFFKTTHSNLQALFSEAYEIAAFL